MAASVIEQFFGDPSSNLMTMGKILCAIGRGASPVSLFGGTHSLVECQWEYFGSGYTKIRVDCPTFDKPLTKLCLRRLHRYFLGH